MYRGSNEATSSNGRSLRNRSQKKTHNGGSQDHKNNFGAKHGFSRRFNHIDTISNESSKSYFALGLKRLLEFLTKTNDEVITALDKSVMSFRQNLQLASHDDDVMIVLVQVIGEKICGETALNKIQNNLVTLASDISFLEKILKFISQLSNININTTKRSGTVDRCNIRILNALSAFYGLVCARMPAFAADKLLPYIQAAYNINELLSLKSLLNKEKSIDIGLRFETLIREIHTVKEVSQKKPREDYRFYKRPEMTREDREKLYLITPEDNFSKMEIIPSIEEIISDEEPFLRPNLIYGKYPSALTYLDVQFRLLKEDFIAPLRESVKEYLNHAKEYDTRRRRPPPGTVRIYLNVTLKKVECTLDHTFFTMKFMTNNLKRVKWENSKRLLTGSLLLLTADRFKTIFFATVGRRDEKKLPYGLIDIIWEGKRPDTYKNVTFLMFECEVYFESYRHTLKALQGMGELNPPHYDRPRLETFKMSKYIINVTTEPIKPPKYLREIDWSTERLNFRMLLVCNQEAIKLRNELRQQNSDSSTPNEIDDTKNILPKLVTWKINPLQLHDWPSAMEIGMDQPQYMAFQSAITQELSIIQGPPGTGKTYIGLQIMKLLLANPKITSNSPILVVCYTNHALDQFLEGILSIMHSLVINPYRNLIRVGGQSKVEDIQKYSLRNIRQDYIKYKKFHDDYAQLRRRTRSELFSYQNSRADLKSYFCDLKRQEGIVNFTRLNEKIKSNKLTDSSCLHSLLSKQLASIFLDDKSSRLFHWLEMDNEMFNSDHIKMEVLLKRSFKMIRVERNERRVTEEVEIPEADVEFEDEELRRILVAHRMEEEILEEERTYKAARLEYTLHYKHEEFFRERANELSGYIKFAQQNRDFRHADRLQRELYLSGLERKKFTNQCIFIKELFKACQDGRIDLPKVTPDLLDRANSARQLKLSEKWSIYFYFIDEVKKYLIAEMIKLESHIIEAQKKMMEVNNQGDGFILEKAKVVGLTTTGAAKYNSAVRMMKSKIVIVEEAAEVLESHIVTCITNHCEHLILIGDHQQLRPPTTVYKLAKDYHLDISLFERLIRNNISWKYLKAQHRMRPEICKILVPTIYNDLENHSSVYFYPPVKGFLKNIFFITHSTIEREDTDSMTKSNEYEANYVIQICRYLMLQGYKPSQVTILTTYIGQMFLIKKLMMEEGKTCNGVRVTVVDNFQGEENDIILLSLVRSNAKNKIGFLKTHNRICVALSRAKQGLYIVGNMDCLTNSPSLAWQQISNELQEQGCIGRELKLQCPNHDEIIEITSHEEFQQKSPEGGCTRMCPGVLPRCDHVCRFICHANDREHLKYQCKEQCDRHCPDSARHKCPRICSAFPCPPCEIKMKRKLPCDHVIELSCGVNVVTYECKEMVQRSLECGHTVHLRCHVPVKSHVCEIKVIKTLDCFHTKQLPCNLLAVLYECNELVTKELDCGHRGVMKCIDDPAKFDCLFPSIKKLLCGHEQLEPCNVEITNIKCGILIGKVALDCKHEVKVPCHQLANPEKWICGADCDTRLNCGHQCIRKCHLQDDPDHINYQCPKTCGRSCVNDHKCRKKHLCSEPCNPCKVNLNRTLTCGHTINAQCSQDLENYKCERYCKKPTLLCGHNCLKKCFETCLPCMSMTEKKSSDCPHTIQIACNEKAEKSKCNELVTLSAVSLCGHVVKVPCRIQNTCSPEDCLQYCRSPCNYRFDYEGGCGHVCQGDCSSCYQGRIHRKCNIECGRTLVCGHICKFPCSSLCPPCEDVCILQCKHSKCKKKCGEPCINCEEPCKWACKHARCSRKCSMTCNRDPCNKPCEKKLECGHDCIGYCGDLCPPFCRICNKDTVQEILFGDEDKENARFIYLENCGHIIHREAMDEWMSSKTKNSGTNKNLIDVKRCPKCTTIITQCGGRYGNIIKKHFKEVLAVRNKIFGNNRLQKLTQLNIAKNLQLLSNTGCQFKYLKNFLERKLFVMKDKFTKNIPGIEIFPLDVNQYIFESLHNIVSWWEEAEKNVGLNEIDRSWPRKRRHAIKQDLTTECRNELIEMYNKLFNILIAKKLPLSSQERSDFAQEFTRIYDFYRLGLRQSIDKFDSFDGAQLLYNIAHNRLVQIKPYDEDSQKIFETYLNNLEKNIKTGWKSFKEKQEAEARDNRKNIFAAIGFAGNHWYHCSKGHLYVVADCGALNQSGECPECGEIIGRGSRNIHAVRNEVTIQQQINNVVDIFPERYDPPTFSDPPRNSKSLCARRRRGRR